jgi:hypothetical protein
MYVCTLYNVQKPIQEEKNKYPKTSDRKKSLDDFLAGEEKDYLVCWATYYRKTFQGIPMTITVVSITAAGGQIGFYNKRKEGLDGF